MLRVKSTKINTVQNGKKLWEFSKCSSEGLGHDNHLIDILTKRTCLAYMYASTHMVKWSWSLHGMSFHGSPVTHLTHRKGWYKIFQYFSKMYWSLVQTQFWLAQKFEKRESLTQIMDLVLDSPRFWKKYRKSLVQYKIYGINISMVHHGMPWKGMPWSMHGHVRLWWACIHVCQQVLFVRIFMASLSWCRGHLEYNGIPEIIP